MNFHLGKLLNDPIIKHGYLENLGMNKKKRACPTKFPNCSSYLSKKKPVKKTFFNSFMTEAVII